MQPFERRRVSSRSQGQAGTCMARIADMSAAPLLTNRSKTIFRLVDVVRFVSSSLGPKLRHPDRRCPSLSAGPPGKWRSLLPRPFAFTLDLSSGSTIRLHSSSGASFFAPTEPSAQRAHRGRDCEARMANMRQVLLRVARYAPIFRLSLRRAVSSPSALLRDRVLRRPPPSVRTPAADVGFPPSPPAHTWQWLRPFHQGSAL